MVAVHSMAVVVLGGSMGIVTKEAVLCWVAEQQDVIEAGQELALGLGVEGV